VRRDLTGQVFGRLTAEIYLPGSRNKRAQWQCRCECGASINVCTSNLGRGHTESCGCLKQEKLKAGTTKTHGQTRTSEYQSWIGAKARCENPNQAKYHRYGGRGITMCQRWRDSFEAFFADMGPKPSPKHSIDRIDNDGPYSPENCRWATPTLQARNTSRNTTYMVNGASMCGSEVAEKLGLQVDTVFARRKLGWSDEKIATTPLVVRRFTFQGETLTVREWANRTGIDSRTLDYRLRAGWPIAKVLTRPVQRGVTR
jgi:hypothetical protein